MWHVADSTVHYNILCDMSREIREREREIMRDNASGDRVRVEKCPCLLLPLNALSFCCTFVNLSGSV